MKQSVNKQSKKLAETKDLKIKSANSAKPISLSSADLVVLSLLGEKPMHGYKIVSELTERDAEDWAPVSRPQVYYTLKKIVKNRYITSVTDTSATMGPERETFYITQKGLKAMNDSLSVTDWAQKRPPPPFLTWMALSTHVTKEKTKQIINARQSYLTNELKREKKTLLEFKKDTGAMTTSGCLMVSLTIELFQTELRWLKKVEAELPKARKK
ncbi:MAG: PadR family transcriptional regulator [Bdellovibrio sp.]|nr:PadR family transcriptional regulator [Bdellovibrio sp.]